MYKYRIGTEEACQAGERNGLIWNHILFENPAKMYVSLADRNLPK